MVTPGLPLIAMNYNVSIDMVSSLIIGFLAFWIGFTTFFTAAGANIWGKRPFFVISTVILLATNVWGFFTRVCSYRNQLLIGESDLNSPSSLWPS
jgi:hypothetical protein